MRREATDSEALIAALAGEAKAAAGEHLEPELLFDYRSAALSPAAEDRVRDHLVGCRRCTRLLLDLEPFVGLPSQSDSEVANLTAIASWREFKARVGDMDRASGGRRHPAPGRQPGARIGARGRASGGRRQMPRALSAIAASLALGVLGLSFWAVQLRQAAEELSLAQTNQQWIQVDGSTRGDEVVRLDKASAKQKGVILSIIPNTTDTFETFHIELLDAEGEEVWQDTAHELSESETLRTSFQTWVYPAGDYRVLVHGVDGDRREVVRDAQLRIRYKEGFAADDEI